ncbi:uncharacterized protein LOC131625941 [Vicia villosa]|uniref:uncharacterized protein LOC131625941 n=1 Tax=Vicia villosa TaxID=3911 RepID=UPI00273BD226|nr:uncharacterized protein LOC131625941 [Vicia villosa]
MNNNNNNNSSFLSHHRNPKNYNHHHHDQCPKPTVHKCEFCHKIFPTGQALGGHKTCHRSNKQILDDHVNKVYKTMKVTFSLSCSPSNQNNDVDAKPKRHSWTRVFKTTVHHPPTASPLKPSQQQELPAVDLLSLLPPRSYNTKKRSRRYLVDDGLANNTAPILPLLDMSRESIQNLDLSHEYKRVKLSINGNDSEMMHKQHVLPTNDHVDETVANMSEGEIKTESRHELGSRVIRNFDLNDLPTNHVETVVSRVVRNFDLNDLPANDVEIE